MIAGAAAVTFGRAAHADCSAPSAPQGSIDYFAGTEQVFKYCDGTNWQPWVKGLDNLGDVDTTGAVDGSVLLYSGGNWVPGTVSGSGGGSSGDYQVFITNGTWTKPAGLDANQLVVVEIWGGGAGGSNNGASAGGGGGGAYNRVILKAGNLGASVAVTVGAGGALQTAGGNSSFGAFGTAYGGGSSNAAGGGGGGGALSLGSNASGTTGGNGGNPGGGAGGASGAAGGASIYGGGGGGGGYTSGLNGSVGGTSFYGGGGGGGGSNGGTGGDGGASVYGGGGGGGGGNTTFGGTSVYAGAGGNKSQPGSIPGGGGGKGAVGARGEVRVWVVPAGGGGGGSDDNLGNHTATQDLDLAGHGLLNVGTIGASVDALSDVDTAGAAAGNILMFSGGNWVPGTVSGGSGTDAAFYAYRSGSGQSVNRNQTVKLNFNNELFDTGSAFDTSTDRFTPTIAGTYVLTAKAGMDAPQSTVIIYKNGSEYATGSFADVNGQSSTVSVVAQANGTTDYFEVYLQNGTSGVDGSTYTGSSDFYFSGALVGGGGDGGGPSALGDLADVDTTGAAAGNVLLYSGGNWVPGAITGGGAATAAFYAYRNSTQSLPGSGANTKINFTSESYDTHNDFNTSTDRFTPTIAGTYILTFKVRADGGDTAEPSILKNGSAIATGTYADGTDGASIVTTIAQANGTTDYFEAYLYLDSPATVGGNSSDMYFTGVLIGGGAGSADNLGDHTATQNIKLGANWLSNDGDNEGLRVSADGKVGVGVDPSARFEVYGAGTPLLINGTTGDPGLWIRKGDAGVTDLVGGIINTGNGSVDSNRLAFGFNATADYSGFSEKMALTNAGNLGIGTNDPKSPLHISTGGPRILLFDSDQAISAANPAWQMRAWDSGEFSIQTTTDYSVYTDRLIIDETGRIGIGIGTTTPGYRLDVEDTATITSGGTIGSAHQLTASPAAASSAYLTGLDGRIYTAGASNFTGTLQGLEADAIHQGAGTASSMRAVRAAAVNNNGGVVASGTAGAFSVENAAAGGVITSATALSAEVDHKNTTTVGTATGLYSRVDNGSTGGITTAYGLYAALTNGGGGAVANWYGLYIPAITGAAPTTNRYGVYVGDAGQNYFAGNVGIGDTAPTQSLSLMKSGDDASLNLRTYDNSTNSYIFFDRARGTSSSPQALTSGTQIIGIDAYGYDGSAFAYTGGVYLNAEETFTGSARGSRLSFLVTPNGTTSSITAMRINNAGYVGLGPNAPSPGATLDDSGSFALSGDLTPSQITANQNNYNPANLATAAVLRLSTDASRDITGLQDGADGRVITIINVGTNDIVLKNDVTSIVGNRFLFGADVTLTAGQSAMLWYDSTVSRWRGVATPGSGGGSSIESVSGLSAPPSSESDPQVGTLTSGKWCTSDGSAVNCAADPPGGAPTCVRRTNASGTSAAKTISCNAGEIMTGGGCTHTSTSITIEDSGPTADNTWSCEWSGTGSTGTAYAICCSF